MIKWLAPILSGFALSACAADETISGYADPDVSYHLTEMNGVPFQGRATIRFPSKGQVSGQAPCNRYFATQTLPYPWFNLENTGATRMACPELRTEAAFFEALEEMTLAEVSGNVLILSNTDGGALQFVAR